MKKLRFKELCQDKNTGMYYKRGDVVEFEDARALEIMQHNVAELIETRQEIEPFVEKEETETVEKQKEEAEEVEETETVEEPKEEKPKRGSQKQNKINNIQL